MDTKPEGEGIHPGRNGKGQFLPGPAPRRANPKRDNSQPIKPHPTDPTRDSLGRMLPGCNGFQEARYQRLAKIKETVLDACPPEDVKAMMLELKEIGMDRDCPLKWRLAAMELYFNRCIGKPSTEIFVDKQVTQTKVNVVDFTKLSDNELNQIETILSKTQPEVQVLEYKPSAE